MEMLYLGMESRLPSLGNTFLNFFMPITQAERPLRCNSAPPYISLRSCDSSSSKRSALSGDLDRDALSTGEETCIVHDSDTANNIDASEYRVGAVSQDASTYKKDVASSSCLDDGDIVSWRGPDSWSWNAQASECISLSGGRGDVGLPTQITGVAVDAEGSRPADGIESATEPFARALSAAPTTLIIQNLPYRLLQTQLADEIDRSGFLGKYDFLYMPSEYSTGRGKGFAFVNFTSPGAAEAFTRAWCRSCRFPSRSSNVLSIAVARLQGRAANMARWVKPKMCRIRNPTFRPICPPEGLGQLSAVAPAAWPLPCAPPQAPQIGCPALSFGRPTTAAFAMVPRAWAPAAAAARVMAPAQSDGMDGTGEHLLGGVGGVCTSAPPGEDTDIIGKWCMIHDLVVNPDFNGAWCHVESFDTSMQRYTVRVLTMTSAPMRAKLRREHLSMAS